MKKINLGVISYAIFFLLTIIILWDLLLPGYILTLDMVFGPQVLPKDFPFYINSPPTPDIPMRLMMYLLNLFMPVWMIQKIILFFIIFLSGVLAYNLCPSKQKIGKLYAGILYMINPFVFVRFLAGHLDILIGYAFLPLLVKLAMEYEDNRVKKMIQIGLVLSIISISYHLLMLSLLFLSIIFIAQYISSKKIDTLKNLVKILSIYFLLNSYWILPFILNTESKTHTFASWISGQDIGLFTPKGATNFNVLFNVGSMHGFWRSAYDYAKFHLPFWYVLYFVILFLSIHGFLIIKNDKRLRLISWLFVIFSVILLIFATGTSLPSFSKIFTFFFEKFPLFRGFREPHKLLSVVVLMYSFFGGVAVGDFSKEIKTQKLRKSLLSLIIVAIFFSTPLIYSYTMLFGFKNQLGVSQYPEEWERAEEVMKRDDSDFNILFLPWHMYMDFNFNPKQRIANPANAFFSKPVISGDNIEAGGIYSQSNNPTSRYIEFLLFNKNRIKNFGSLVSHLNVKYIILAKQADWLQYNFLFNQTDLQLIEESDQLVLFKNNINTTKIYSANKIIFVDGEDFFKAFDNSNSTRTVYLSKGLWKNYSLPTLQSNRVSFSKNSAISYELSGGSGLVVLTDLYSEGWVLDGQKPVRTFMGTNLFISKNPNKLYFSRFNYYIIGYLASLGTFIFILVMYFKKDQKVAKRK